MNDMINNNTPSNMNAAILPPGGMFLISYMNNLASVISIKVSAVIRSGLNLCFIPNHIMANAQIPQMMLNPAFEYKFSQ